ncbi:cell division protein FtsQ/DivIB [Desulfotomaculum copahuensis]|uniref:cell division protein FtsQ/DivIB n=1 Tax=Desulfotomaculum copahuensis TaxID=1838280 RepID=UPI000B337181|nr:FtsQ-type POTRA domain-containing protein [Desulfotomaculum copahuensis]
MAGTPGLRRTRINLGESIFFVLLVLLSVFILLGSPLFDVREITVQGNHYMSADKIIKASGITAGTNIFKINLGQAAQGLKALPLLKDVQLSRQLPGRVVIRVTERQPVALLPWGSGFVQVDGDGVCLQNGSVSGNLPLITGINVRVPPPGQVVQGAQLPAVLKAIRQLPPSLVRQLSEVHRTAQGQVILYTLDGVQCRLGTSGDMAGKGAVLLQVLNKVRKDGRKIDYIDLSYPGMPVVKYSS